MSRDALIVGISSYEVLNSLQTPADDAEAVAQLLTQYGEFNVTRLPGVIDKTTNLLRVGRKTKVTQRQLKEALVQLLKPTGKHLPDTALFYFSGHGTRENLGLPQGFLATSDTHPEADHWGLSLKWLRELLQDSPIKQQIIWLDCCYSGELLNFEEANPLDQGKVRDRCFIAASREFEVAYEGIASSHSIFTEALLQALDPTRHPEGLITNLTLVDLINRSLKQTVQRPLHTNVGSPILLTRWQRERFVSPPTTPSEVCPYKGLLYFDCNDIDPLYFFGREKLTDQLLEQVRVHHLLAVLGVSGSGKSSVVRAGVLYQLQQGRKLSGSETWPQLILRPGERPLQSLAWAFVEDHLSVVERAQQAQQAEELIARGAKGFQHLVKAKAGSGRLVILIDQFEEVFTRCQHEAERQAFFDCLFNSLDELGQQICVVLTMRADFFGKCAAYQGLAQRIQAHLFTVLPMDSTELRQAIERPAQLVQLTVEPELVDTMIKEVAASPGSLPLLEYTLWLLWQQGPHRLSLAEYVRLGGVNGALQQRADEVYASLTEEEQITAKAIFLELTQLGEGTEDTRKQIFKQDLITPHHTEVLIERTLQKLTDARLVVMDAWRLRSESEQVVTVVDVAHETIIRHWTLLRTWIKENREFKAWRDKLRQAEREWQEKQQDEGLLLRGAKLLETQEREKVYREWLTAREAAFIAASAALREREREEKQRIQQTLDEARQRELEQAKQLAETQSQRIEEQKIAAKRLRHRLTWAMGGLILAVIAAGVAIFFWQLAQQQAQVSKLRQLNAQSILALKAPDSFNGYFDRALLLAVQAFKEQDNLETRGTLLRVMQSVDENHPFAYLHGHRDTVTSVVFSPDGQILATGSNDNIIILWQVATQKLLATLQGYSSPVISLAFSPDGQILASGGNDGKIILWKVTTQKLVATLQGHSRGVSGLAFSPDGQTLVSSSWDQTVILWKVTTQKPVATLQGHSSPVTRLALSPDGQTLASGSMDKTITLWKVTTQKPVATLQGHSSQVNSLAFSPDSQILASGGEDKTIILWKVATRKLVVTLQGHNGSITSLAFSPDGQTLASGNMDHTIIFWDVGTQKPSRSPLQLQGYDNWVNRGLVNRITFSPNGKILVSSGNPDNSVILWEVAMRKPLVSPLQKDKGYVSDVVFSPNGKILASGHGNGSILLWDVTTRQPLGAPLQKHRDVVTSVAFSPDGQVLASGSGDGTVLLWNIATQQLLGSPLQGQGNMVSSIAFSPDGKILASSGIFSDHTLLWDITTHQPIGSPLQGYFSFPYVDVSTDGDRIIVSSGDLTFSPDGKTLAGTSEDGTILLWNVATHQPLGSPLQGHHGDVTSVVFSPDGKILASGSKDGTILLWNVATHQLLGSPLQGHHDAVISVTFSPDGEILASGSMDETIFLWDVATHQPIGAPLQEHRGDIMKVVFSPNGKNLVSCSEDKSILLWDIDPQSWQQRACRIAGRNLTRQEWQDSVGNEPYQKTCPEYPSDEALAMIEEGKELAEKTELQDIETATAKFKEAFALDPLLKEHPLYHFDPEKKAKKIAASVLVDKGKSLAGEEKLEEAIAVFKRAQELDVSLKEDKQLTVLLPFFSWLVDPKKDWKEVLTAIEQHSDLTIVWDFSDLEPVIQQQEPPDRQQMAQHFIDFLTGKIDLATLKENLNK